MKDFREQNFYELLDISPHASQQELELSYQRARRVFSSNSVATYALFQAEELNLLRRRIEEAFRVLSNPERRSLYDRDVLAHEDGWVGAAAGSSLPEAPVSIEPVLSQAASGLVSVEARDPIQSPMNSLPVEITPETPAANADAVSISTLNQKPFLGSHPDSTPAPERLLVTQEGMTRSASFEQTPNADLSIPASEPPRLTPESVSTTLSFPAASAPSVSARPLSVPPPLPTPAPPAPMTTEHPPMPEINEATEFTGELLTQVRKARGLTLERITDTTKINIFYLRAIENEKYADLPAEVYVRGYLRQIVNLLGLDPQHVVPSYLERMKKGRK
jgi:hypothetical protein